MRACAAAVVVLLALALAAGAAHGQTTTGTAPQTTTGTQGPTTTTGTVLPTTPKDPNALSRPQTLTAPPIGHRLTGTQARAIAARHPKVRAALRAYPTARPEVFLKGATRWQVSWFTPGAGSDRKEVVQVYVDDATGGILEAWSGFQVPWTMARGYSGAFGRKVNVPWIWIPMTLLFVAPFVSVRRPLRMLHLDLLVLVGFGVSVAFFNDANIHASVPIIAPLLAYLLVRMLAIGLARPSPRERRPLHLNVPVAWLAVAIVFLVGFRVGLNLESSNVIDVGYSGVIGADRLVDGKPLYGGWPSDNSRGDTYGPVLYAAYVPFEQVLPWSGRWDDLPAAHAAAITFDLLALVLLFLVGRRLGGRGLGVVLAYAWATYPFTLYCLSCNSNDALVAVFAALALLVASSPVGRGVAGALGGLAKFGSLALAPLLATHGARGPVGGARWRRDVIPFVVAFALVLVVAFIPVMVHGPSLREVYDRTIGFQASRDAPFSIWGLYDLDGLQRVWQGAALMLAVAAAVLPRRRDVIGLAAVGAAVVIALQLGLTYWFYLYLVWFFPFVVVALFARHGVEDALRPVRPWRRRRGAAVRGAR